jgi:hypothetical protein
MSEIISPENQAQVPNLRELALARCMTLKHQVAISEDQQLQLSRLSGNFTREAQSRLTASQINS